MVKRIYAVYDVKTGVYGNPFFLLSDGEAIRTITDAVSAKGNTLSEHPNDFRVDYLGEIELTTGQIMPNTPLHLVEVAQLVQK